MQIIEGKKYFDAPPIHKISDILNQGLEKFPDRKAIVYRKTPQSELIKVNYRQLYTDAASLKNGLLSLGLGRKVVSLVGGNSYQWMLAYLSVTWDMGVISPLDSMLTGIELSHLIERSHSSAIFLDIPALKSLIDLDMDFKDLRYWIVSNIVDEKDFELVQKFKEKNEHTYCHVLTLEELQEQGRALLAEGKALPDYPYSEEEPAVILFTSGTTAISKAVILSNKNIAADIQALLETVTFVDPLYSLSLLPLHHTFENTCGFLSVLSLGGCIHVCDGLRYIGKNIKEHKVHMVIGVPKVFEAIQKRIMQNIQRSGQEGKFKFGLFLSKVLRFFGIDKRRQLFKDVLKELGGEWYVAISGGAALDKDVIEFFDKIGIEILQGYGLTETSPVVVGCNTQYNVIGSCGQPLSGVTVAIDSPTPGEPGEILVKGDMVMLGYYENEEANKETFTEDGWLRTGDIAYLDQSKQVIYLTGRSKSMIVLPSGKKVFPEELEALLNRNEIIKDSLVFPQTENNGDIVLSAKLVLDKEKLEPLLEPEGEGIKELLEQLINDVNKSMPSFKGIRSYFYSFKDMVKTTTLKIKRNIEIEQMEALFRKHNLTWKDLIAVNIDDLQEKSEAESKQEISE